MANIKTVRKVEEYLSSNNSPVSVSEIVLSINITRKSVLDVLELLSKFNRVEIMSNGKTTLVRWNDGAA